MNRKAPRVSVIIPVYNGAKYVAESVASVLAQTYRDLELIVVDDGSTDETQKVLAQFGSKITVITLPHTGVSYARNQGIASSTGEFIAMQDCDDLWEPSKLSEQIAYLDAHPEMGLVYCYSTNFTGKDAGNVALVKKLDFEGDIFVDLVTKNSFGSPTTLFRKVALDQVGLYDESLIAMEDYEFNLRFSRKYKIGRVAKSLVRRRIHPDSFYSCGYDNQYIYQLPVFEKLLDDPEVTRLLHTTKRVFMTAFILKFVYKNLYDQNIDVIAAKLADLKRYSRLHFVLAKILVAFEIKAPLLWQRLLPEFAVWHADVAHRAA